MSRTDRAQTTQDFAIGISIFLLVITVVFSFVPTLVQPFDGSRQSDTVVANRVASDLAERTLTVGPHRYTLDTDCTVAFFDDALDSGSCRFDNHQSIRERVGVSDLDHIQIELRGKMGAEDAAPTRLCWNVDGSARSLVAADSADCDGNDPVSSDVILSTGDVPQTSTSISTAVRVVSIDGYHAELLVRVW